MVAATGVVIVVLALLALQLHATQSSSRDRLVARFHDRAQVISALTQAVLSSAATPAAGGGPYGAATVSTATLDRTVAQSHLAYAVLLNADGTVIAASRGLTPAARDRLATAPPTRAVARGAPLALGDVAPSPTGAGGSVLSFAARIDAPSGRRVLISGAPLALFGTFLNDYLRRVPTQAGTAYVLDRNGRAVGVRDRREALGRVPAEPGLADAARDAEHGAYGHHRYFVASPVKGTGWTVVLTSSQAALFNSVTGARKWTPWLIFAALALTALAVVALLQRVLSRNAALAAGNARLESSNALLRHAAELARSNAELEQFASIASHDLQEPLRKVQTFAAQLNATESDRLSEQGQDFLRRMSDAAGRMRTLIDDLLAFSRVSTKGRPFVSVALDDVVEQVLGDLEIAVAESGAGITIQPLPTIAADPVQMRQLFLNLLGNALKFRRPGVTPEVVVTSRVADGIAEITVADNGLGFDPDYATRIFRAFERLHGASAYPGTGIGLALCRKIAERHSGAIAAVAREGEGATFTVRLPVQPPDDGAATRSLFPEPTSDEVPHALA